MALEQYNWLAKMLLGVLLIISQLGRPDFGFVAPVTAEAIGYDSAGLAFWIGGAYLIYAGVRDRKKVRS